MEDRSDEDEEDEDGASDGEGHEDDVHITDSSPEGAAVEAKRASARATLSGEDLPPGSSRGSSVESSPTITCAGADTGATARSKIADLGCGRKQYQHNMPIATTPHPDAPAYNEALSTAKEIKGRREDMMQTSCAQTHQRLSTPPPLLEVPHTHLHSHSDLQPQLYQHHVHLTYTHGIEMPSGFWNEFTHPILPHPHS